MEIGQYVYHKRFGVGKVKEINNNSCNVIFHDGLIRQIVTGGVLNFLEEIPKAISKFFLTHQPEEFFDDYTCQKGYKYCQQSRIKDITFLGNCIRANVLGTSLYTLDLNIVNNTLDEASCSCPVGLYCKHTAAVFIYFYQQFYEFSSAISQDLSDDIKDAIRRYGMANQINPDDVYNLVEAFRKIDKRNIGNFIQFLTENEFINHPFIIYCYTVSTDVLDNYSEHLPAKFYSIYNQVKYTNRMNSYYPDDYVIYYHAITAFLNRDFTSYLGILAELKSKKTDLKRIVNLIAYAAKNSKLDKFELLDLIYCSHNEYFQTAIFSTLEGKVSIAEIKENDPDLLQSSTILGYLDKEDLSNHFVDLFDNPALATVVAKDIDFFLEKMPKETLGVIIAQRKCFSDIKFQELKTIICAKFANPYLNDYFKTTHKLILRTPIDYSLDLTQLATIDENKFWELFEMNSEVNVGDSEYSIVITLNIGKCALITYKETHRNKRILYSAEAILAPKESDFYLKYLLYKFNEKYDLASVIAEGEKQSLEYLEYKTKQKMLVEINQFSLAVRDYETRRLNEQAKVALVIRFSSNNDNDYSLTMQIGNAKMYKIKDNVRFRDFLRTNAIYAYGKSLELYHTLENFQFEFQKFISLFQITYPDNEIIDSSLLDQYLKCLEGNEVYLDGNLYLISSQKHPLNLKVTEKYNLELENADNIRKIGTTYYVLNRDLKQIYQLDVDYRSSFLVDLACKFQGESIRPIKDYFIKEIYLRYPNLVSVSPSIKTEFSYERVLIQSYFDYQNKNIICETHYLVKGQFVEEESINDIASQTLINLYKEYLLGLGFVDNVLSETDKLINFFNLDFTYLRSLAEVYLSDNVQNKLVMKFKHPVIRLENKNSLVEIFYSNLSYTEEELKVIMQALAKNKRYVLLDDNRIMTFEEQDYQFYQLAKNLGLTNVLARDNVPLYQAFKAANCIDTSFDEYLEKVFHDVTKFKEVAYQLPKLKMELRNYQIEGFKWLKTLEKYHFGGILADEMGLGKTLQIIALLKDCREDMPSLIVCPKSLIFNWISEFRRFDDTLVVKGIYGLSDNRIQIINKMDASKKVIYITSYESLRNDINHYEVDFSYVILDEAQFVKNVAAQKSQVVRQLKANHRLALTGTPIENSILDLWSIFEFIMPNYLPPLKEYENIYDNNYKQIALSVAPFILRRCKSEVLQELPNKYERIIVAQMHEEQRKLYDATILNAKLALKNGNSFETLRMLNYLREICVAPEMYVSDYSSGSAKLDLLYDIIKEYLSNNHKILIFSQYVKVLNIIADKLSQEGLSYFILTGQTKAEDRLLQVNSFNASRQVNLFLISLKAGGTGLNLTGADTVIHVDPWWNVAAENQATDRAHRIGQKSNVEVIKLICEDTIESKILDLQAQKLEIVDKLISQNDDKITSLTKEDLQYILGA